jgi:hypothetical protein
MAEDTAGQFLSDSGVDFLQIVVDRADVERAEALRQH